MIKTWSDEETRQLFDRQKSRKIAQNIQKVALRKLHQLNAATQLNDLAEPPANNLKFHKVGANAGHWSIKINDQWRLVFDWKDGNAYEVAISDYH
jgi:proteic killer suppression protein